MMTATASNHTVRHFRNVLFWPVQLMPLGSGAQTQSHWELLAQGGADNPWRMLEDRFQSQTLPFEERPSTRCAIPSGMPMP